MTGSPGSIFFFNKKWRHFGKKKSQRVANEFLTGSYQVSWVTQGFLFPCFFFNSAWSNPGSLIDLLDQTGFQNYSDVPFAFDPLVMFIHLYSLSLGSTGFQVLQEQYSIYKYKKPFILSCNYTLTFICWKMTIWPLFFLTQTIKVLFSRV